MAYEPQEWKPFQEGGTIITADALNYMEAGIASTSSDQEALREYCYQLDNDIKADTQTALDQMTTNVNKALKEQADTFNAVNEANFNNLKGYTDDTAAELREEIANVQGTTVAFNALSWSCSMTANTLTTLTGGAVSGDGPIALSSNSVFVPDTVKAAFLTLRGTLPVAGSTTGRRYMEIIENSSSALFHQELYAGYQVTLSMILMPGQTYTVRAACGGTGTVTANATVVSLS